MSTNALIVALESGKNLLQVVGETFWSGKINHLLARMSANHSADDIRNILSWFGGMGSFNDLIISAANDHDVNPDEESKYNDELDRIRETIYVEANKLAAQTD